MSRNKSAWSLGLYWVPFILGLSSACLYLVYLALNWGTIKPGLLITLILGTIIGTLAIAMAIFAAADARALAKAQAREKSLEGQLIDAAERARTLNSHLEVMTAIGEVTRILTDAVDFKQITGSVFDVLQPLFQADEIALILKNDNGSIALKALRRDGRNIFDDELKKEPIPLADAEHALKTLEMVKGVEAGTAVFDIPLVADQAPVGVMRFRIPLGQNDTEAKERELRDLEATLSDIAKHLALVVKTPGLHDRAIIDSLTGLFTRRHFDMRMDDMFRLARRYATPFSLILSDIDHFKEVNDRHGHGAGDEALRQTATTLTGAIRDCDSAFRYGGEEFAILLPETTARQAQIIAERLRKNMKAHVIKTDNAEIILTLSIGISEYNPEMANSAEMLAQADHALYRAKNSGRDTTVVAYDIL